MNSMNTTNRAWKLSLLFLLGSAFALIFSAKTLLFAFSPLHPGAEDFKIIEVRKGINPNELTKQLISNGMISDGKEFLWLGRLTRHWKRLKVGEYKISPSMSPFEILSLLTSGVSVA